MNIAIALGSSIVLHQHLNLYACGGAVWSFVNPIFCSSVTFVADASQQGASSSSDGSPASNGSLERDLSRFTRQAAGTFAPRPSTASKNPAVKGSTLYQIFEVQAWIGLVAGGLLSFNIIFPTEQPDIPRLLG